MTQYPAAILLSELDGTTGVRLNGESGGDLAGYAIAVGDANGDGYADILIGAPSAAAYQGAAYLVLGHQGVWNATFDLGGLSGPDGFVITAPEFLQVGPLALGVSVALVDLGRDGFADLVLGTDATQENPTFRLRRRL